MFELPELICMSKQMNQTLSGKVVQKGSLGNSPHKFVWYNHTPEDFEQLTRDKTIGKATPCGRWLFLDANPDYRFVFGECGGKMLFHPTGSPIPPKYHLLIHFTDGSFFTIMTQMWGAMELYLQGEETNRPYIKDMRPLPTGSAFTQNYFNDLVHDLSLQEKRSVKSLLTQDQIIPGLGNAIAQDIMFVAGLNPKHPIQELDSTQIQILYKSIGKVIEDIVSQGGRYDEVGLFGQPGGYIRLMDKQSAGKPCPKCGTTIASMQYLGGSCYYCPNCQI
jgi:formamidopyrimidine-DNA glycosylase